MTKAKEKAHAKFSASASDRWLACPGSIALSENAPPQETSVYAAEGTEAHSCLEMLLQNHIGGVTNIKDGLEKTYPAEMVHHACIAFDHIIERAGSQTILLCETKVSLEFIAPDMFGTVDAAIVDEFGRLWVFDYKYGAGYAVEPENNTQLIYYALGIAHKYNYNFSDVCISIIQPRAPHKDGPVREWVIEMDELRAWTEKFTAGVKAAEDPFAPLKSGDHCRWCPAKAICPEISNKAFNDAQIEFDTQETGALMLPPEQALTAEKLSLQLRGIEKIEMWIDAVKAHALQMAERGSKIPGYKLVAKRSTRKWVDAERVAKLAEYEWGKKAFSTPELLSPAQLEKVCKPDEKWVEKHTTSVSSGVTLVSDDDARPGVNRVDNDFTEVIEETKQTKPTKQLSKGVTNVKRKNANRKKEGTLTGVSRKLPARVRKAHGVRRTGSKILASDALR